MVCRACGEVDASSLSNRQLERGAYRETLIPMWGHLGPTPGSVSGLTGELSRQLSLRMSLLRAPPTSSASVSTIVVLTLATMIWPTSVFTLE